MPIPRVGTPPASTSSIGAVPTSRTLTHTQPAAGLTITPTAAQDLSADRTWTYALANDLLALEGLASTGIAVRSASDTWVQRSIAVGSASLTISNGNGVSANPTLDTAQNIQTSASPTFVGGTFTGLTASVPVVTDGSKNLASVSYATFAGSINASLDHGTLLGLADDDHTQYFLLAGRNADVANLIQNGITTTSTQTLALQNTTASTSGVTEQYSPALDFIGHSWKSGIGAADRTVRFREELQTLTGALSPTGTLVFKSSVDTGTPSFTNRLTLTSGGVMTVSDAQLTTATVTGNLTLGADVVISRRTTNIAAFAAGDSLEVPTNFAVGTTITANTYANLAATSTATSGNIIGYDSQIQANPAGASSARYYGMRFVASVTSANAQNFTDATGGLTGLEGNAQHNGTGTVTSLVGLLSFSSMSSTGTVTTGVGVDSYGIDASSGGTVTTWYSFQGRGPRLSGNGTVTTAYMFYGVPRTVSGSGVVTDQRFFVGSTSGLNAYTANNQTRVGGSLPVMPDPGANTGTTTAAWWIGSNGTPTTARDGIWWGSGLDFGIFRTGSAAGQITGTLVVDGDLKLKTAGNGLYVKEGSNATMGQATLSSGTVTVNTTKVTANSRIFVLPDGGTLTNVGFVWVSARSAGTSFTITSSNILDASNVDWIIVEPA